MSLVLNIKKENRSQKRDQLMCAQCWEKKGEAKDDG